jgi:hypothetical protein
VRHTRHPAPRTERMFLSERTESLDRKIWAASTKSARSAHALQRTPRRAMDLPYWPGESSPGLGQFSPSGETCISKEAESVVSAPPNLSWRGGSPRPSPPGAGMPARRG